MARPNLNWQNVDIEGMTANKALRSAWADYQDAKQAFEDLFTLTARKSNKIQPDEKIAFSYRHGGLGIAITKSASARPTFEF